MHIKMLLPVVLVYWISSVTSVTQHNTFRAEASQAIPSFLQPSSQSRKGGQSIDALVFGKQLDTSSQPEPEPEPEPGYDHCSHPFHSWLCQKPKPRKTRPPPQYGSAVLSEPGQGKALFPEPQTTPPPPPPTTAPYDICSDPLHAWRCLPPSTTTEDNFPSGQFLAGEPMSTTKPPPTTTTTTPKPTTPPPRAGGLIDSEPQGGGKSLSDPREAEPQPEPEPTIQDICNHPFHSFLCQKTRPRKPWSSPRRRTTTPPPFREETFRKGGAIFPDIITTSTTTTTTTTTTTPAPTTTTTTTTPAPTTTTPPPRSGGQLDSEPQGGGKALGGSLDLEPQRAPQPEPQPEPEPTIEDICNHPFHSFLCQKPKPRKPWSSPRTTTTPSPPVSDEPFQEASFVAPTAQVADPQDGRADFPEATAPDAEPVPEPEPVGKCDHPVHSWMCKTAPGRNRQIISFRSNEGQAILNRLSQTRGSLQANNNNNFNAPSQTRGSLRANNNNNFNAQSIFGKSLLNQANNNNNFNAASTFGTFSSNQGSFNSFSNNELGQNIPTVPPPIGFIPTVPTVPFAPTVPTVPAFPTVPTVPFVPTVPTVPFIPTVPTVPPFVGNSLFGSGSELHPRVVASPHSPFSLNFKVTEDENNHKNIIPKDNISNNIQNSHSSNLQTSQQIFYNMIPFRLPFITRGSNILAFTQRGQTPIASGSSPSIYNQWNPFPRKPISELNMKTERLIPLASFVA